MLPTTSITSESIVTSDILIYRHRHHQTDAIYASSDCGFVSRESDPISYTRAFFGARLGRPVGQEEAQRLIESASLVFHLLNEIASNEEDSCADC